MAQAFVKLLAISLLTLILCVLAVVGLHTVFSGSQYEAPEMPWFKTSFWWIYQPSKEDLCGGKDLELETSTKDWIIELPVRRQDEKWLVACDSKDAPSLKTYLEKSTHRDWLIDIRASETWGLDEMADLLNSRLDKNHFGITSRAQKVGIYLRKKGPEWLFAADSASLLRLRFFANIYLENAFDFWPDFVITKLVADDPGSLDEREAEELRRRKKRIVWEWDGKSEPPAIAYDGILTTRPKEALAKFSSGH